MRMCACRGTAGFAHVSCLAEQAKILVAEADENNLDLKVQNERWNRWYTCSLCKQGYHGVVRCALGWACWKTYVGRPETDSRRLDAITMLGNGLASAGHDEDALSVREADLATRWRLGDSEAHLLGVQTNLAVAYERTGRLESALQMKREVHSGCLKLNGEKHESTLLAANNYALSLIRLERFEEARSLVRELRPVAQRVLGESHELTLKMRSAYARALYLDTDATLDDLREAVTSLVDTERTTRRVLGGAHPLATALEEFLRDARAALRARERPSPGFA